MNRLQTALTILYIAVAWFVGIFLITSSFLPLRWALGLGLVAWIVALLIYRFLSITGSEEEGLPLGLLLFLPFVCILVGAIWWGLRLLGLGIPKR